MSDHPLRDDFMTFTVDTSPFDAANAFKERHGRMPQAILYQVGDDGQKQVNEWLAWSVENGIVLALHTDARLLVYAGPVPMEAQGD
jgi:hypothetical protein